MSLLALIAAQGGTTPPPDPGPLLPDGETYTMRTAYPWNAPNYLTTPTYDGSGSTVHPDVIDFAQVGAPGGKWGGWRYWMIHTPFNGSDESLENPSVLVSDQAATGWHVPTGVRDPLWFRPGAGLWNNDVDWVYDPVADQIVLVYKAHSTLVVARSGDGITWPEAATPIPSPPTNLSGASPALVRVSAADWRLWSTNDAGVIHVSTTSDPTLMSGWSTPVACAFPGMTGRPWHQDVIRVGGVFYAIVYNRTATFNDGAPPSGLTTATSTDGVNWAVGTPEPFLHRGDSTILADRPSGWNTQPPWFTWDRYHLYRATIQPHENGTHFRMWYSARGDNSWRVGYLRLPRTLWPAPPS